MTERTLPVASGKVVWTALRHAVAPDAKLAAASMLLLAVATGIGAGATRILGLIIDDVGNGRSDRLNMFGIGILAGIVVAGACGLLGRRLLARVVERSLARMRHDAFVGSMRLKLDTVERVGTADPLSRLTADIGRLTETAHDALPLVIAMFLSSTLTLIALVATSPMLALAACAGIPLIVIAVRRYNRANPQLMQAWSEASADVSRSFHEIADGAQTIRSFRSEKMWRGRL